MRWSGKDVTKMPIIGTVTTQELKVNISQSIKIWPSETYNVVEILDEPNGKIYICNTWYKTGVPQIIHQGLVQSFNPIN